LTEQKREWAAGCHRPPRIPTTQYALVKNATYSRRNTGHESNKHGTPSSRMADGGGRNGAPGRHGECVLEP
jgi:hypothetical protein